MKKTFAKTSGEDHHTDYINLVWSSFGITSATIFLMLDARGKVGRFTNVVSPL